MTQHNDLMFALGNLTEAVEGCREDISDLKKAAAKRLDHHSTRLGSLEQSRARDRGIRATLAVLASAIGIERLIDYLR